jgi:hypothetical protein
MVPLRRTQTYQRPASDKYVHRDRIVCKSFISLEVKSLKCSDSAVIFNASGLTHETHRSYIWVKGLSTLHGQSHAWLLNVIASPSSTIQAWTTMVQPQAQSPQMTNDILRPSQSKTSFAKTLVFGPHTARPWPGGPSMPYLPFPFVAPSKILLTLH